MILHGSGRRTSSADHSGESPNGRWPFRVRRAKGGRSVLALHVFKGLEETAVEWSCSLTVWLLLFPAAIDRGVRHLSIQRASGGATKWSVPRIGHVEQKRRVMVAAADVEPFRAALSYLMHPGTLGI
jgi:hypothetical protein